MSASTSSHLSPAWRCRKLRTKSCSWPAIASAFLFLQLVVLILQRPRRFLQPGPLLGELVDLGIDEADCLGGELAFYGKKGWPQKRLNVKDVQTAIREYQRTTSARAVVNS